MTELTRQYIDLLHFQVGKHQKKDITGYDTEALEEALKYLQIVGQKKILQEWIMDELNQRKRAEVTPKYDMKEQWSGWARWWGAEWDAIRKKINPNALIAAIAILFLIVPVKADAKTINMGQCKITYYCSCSECSGPWGNLTATGTRAEEGRTVAVDPDVIAYGTKLLIDGRVYIAEDCGGNVKGDHIDIYLESHSLTEKLGVRYTNVWIVSEEECDE